MDRYLLEDGSGGYQLEDGSGVLLLNSLLASSLFDDFDDNSRNTTLWGTGQLIAPGITAGGTINEVNARVEVTPVASTATITYGGYISADTYNITDDAIYAKVTPGTLPAAQEVYLSFGVSTGEGYRAILSGGSLIFQRYHLGGNTTVASVAYSSATHAWWRLRHDSGTGLVYLDTAPSSASDPPATGDWTNIGSEALAAGVATDGVFLGFGSGTYSSTASPSTVQFDGFNTATTPAAATNITGTAAFAFSGSATATGKGAASGSSTLVFSPAGTLLGKGAVSGSSALTVAPTGTLAGKGALTGSSTLILSPAGAISGSGAMSCASALVFAPTGTVGGTGAISGAGLVTFSAAGSVTGSGGTTTLVSGSATLAFSAAGNINTLSPISGSASFLLTVSASLSPPVVGWQPYSPSAATWEDQSTSGTWTEQPANDATWTDEAQATGTWDEVPTTGDWS